MDHPKLISADIMRIKHELVQIKGVYIVLYKWQDISRPNMKQTTSEKNSRYSKV